MKYVSPYVCSNRKLKSCCVYAELIRCLQYCTLVSVGLATLPHLSELSPLAHLSKWVKTAVLPRSQASARPTPLVEVTRRLITRNNIEHAVDILISFSLLYTRYAINMARHKQ